MNRIIPPLTRSCAKEFAANRQAQNPTEDDEKSSSLDDSLTNLQWLHNIDTQDITSSNSTMSESSTLNEGSSSNSECQSESGDSKSSDSTLKEPKIDYRNNPYLKPPYSCVTLICMAMKDTKKVKMTVSAIYEWIKENFMYYRVADPTWQNSIRHDLSISKCFVKVARKKGEPGKGGFWKINPAYADMFVDGVFKKRRGVKTQKNSEKNSEKNSKKAANKSMKNDQKRYLNRPNDEPKMERQKFSSLRVTNPSDPLDDFDSLKEKPLFSGGSKGKLRWHKLLNDEHGRSVRELADAHGFDIDSLSQNAFNSLALSPPPFAGSHDDSCKVSPDLDLTIQEIATHPPRDHLTTPSPIALNDAMQSLFKYTPPSPPPLHSDDDHPRADTCYDFTDQNNDIMDII